MSDDLDFTGDITRDYQAFRRAALYGLCAAGEPWVGPDQLEGSDHGHTGCWAIGNLIKYADPIDALCARHGIGIDGIVRLVDEVMGLKARMPHPMGTEAAEWMGTVETFNEVRQQMADTWMNKGHNELVLHLRRLARGES